MKSTSEGGTDSHQHNAIEKKVVGKSPPASEQPLRLCLDLVA